MARALKDRIGGSMGLKFVAAMTGVISVLMIAGTLWGSVQLCLFRSRVIASTDGEADNSCPLSY